MTKEEANVKLEALVQSRLEPLTSQLREEIVKARRERLTWFNAGYDAGISDDPTATNVSGKSLSIEQRRTMAAAKYSMSLNPTTNSK